MICIQYSFIFIVKISFILYIQSFALYIFGFAFNICPFLFDLTVLLFLDLYLMSSHFYYICFVSILYSMICIQCPFIFY